MQKTMPKIAINHLTFGYPGHPPVFQDFSWRVDPGEAWAIIGPSGCGKSTLLTLLAGLSRPGSGTICIDGRPIERPRPKTGLVLQDHGLLPWATVAANARLGMTIRKFYGPDGRHAPADKSVNRETADRRVIHWLERLGIAGLQDHFPSQLSRGQRQRTAIARTLVLEPDLLLLDEPFSALDAPTREDLQKLMIQRQGETGMTRIIVTHDIEEAVVMGEKILALTGDSQRPPVVLDNDCAGEAGSDHGAGFRSLCQDLRSLLGDLT
jgi:NitT/TauT family transport system ATP-binding protein